MLFARLQTDVDLKIRRGAWYRVLKVGDLEVVIEVNKKPVAVLKAVLEIQQRPPLRWSVVPKEGRPKSGAVQLGKHYAVCPSCRTRAAVKDKAREMDCPRCKGSFPVAWEEEYLKT
jgi:hypothetical protein